MNQDAKAATRKMVEGFQKILEILVDEAARTFAAIESEMKKRVAEADKPAKALPGWVNRKCLCEHLGVSERTIGNWVARRRIPCVRLGRRVMFKLEDVDEHLKRTGIHPIE